MLLAAFFFKLVSRETLTTLTMTLLQNLSQEIIIFKTMLFGILDWLREHAIEGIFGNIQAKQLCCNFIVRTDYEVVIHGIFLYPEMQAAGLSQTLVNLY
jgi:hypothetical protein